MDSGPEPRRVAAGAPHGGGSGPQPSRAGNRIRSGARRRGAPAREQGTAANSSELHDVPAHNISLINVQAGVALHLIDERPEQARTALAAIKQASNQARSELRSVLDVLREGHEAPPRSPTSGLTRLDETRGQDRGGRAAGDDECQGHSPSPATEGLPRRVSYRAGGPHQRDSPCGGGTRQHQHWIRRARSHGFRSTTMVAARHRRRHLTVARYFGQA